MQSPVQFDGSTSIGRCRGAAHLALASGAGIRGTISAFDGLTAASLGTVFMFDPAFMGGIYVGGV